MIFSQFTGSPIINSILVSEPEVDTLVVREEKKSLKDFASTEEYVRHYFSDIPLLAEVARCESHFRHTESDGVSLLRGRVDRRDVGVMQINEGYHAAASVKLGFDIHTIDGNMEYARYLYEREGIRPWMASSKCWSHFSEKEIARR